MLALLVLDMVDPFIAASCFRMNLMLLWWSVYKVGHLSKTAPRNNIATWTVIQLPKAATRFLCSLLSFISHCSICYLHTELEWIEQDGWSKPHKECGSGVIQSFCHARGHFIEPLSRLQWDTFLCVEHFRVVACST